MAVLLKASTVDLTTPFWNLLLASSGISDDVCSMGKSASCSGSPKDLKSAGMVQDLPLI